MKEWRFVGPGLFTGFWMGQISAWLMLRGECPNAPGMTALSTFGAGMSVFGALMIYLAIRRSRTS
jgi:hypothetical protein